MQPLHTELNAYTLNETDSRNIFDQQIVPEELGHIRGASIDETRRPVAVFILGQTGAGKTRTAPAIKEVMRARRGEPAHFIADTYKTYHPGYSKLLAEKPALASPATGTDARRWLAMAATYAAERRMDVLVEAACRHPQDFAELAHVFHDGGYRVEVVIMAVPEGLSRLGILTRFYERLPEAGSRNLPVRLTPKKVHDESYRGLVDAARFVDESSAVDQVVILRRNDMVAYVNERVHGVWMRPAVTADRLVSERARLPRDERAIADGDLQRLRDRGGSDLLPQLKEIETLLDEMDDYHDGEPLRQFILPTLSVTDEQNTAEADLSLGLDHF